MATTSFKGKFVFSSPINLERSSGLKPISNSTKSIIEVEIKETGVGYADWYIPELDMSEEIGLWFDENELIDYDGVMSFPDQLTDFLEKQGYNMNYVKD